jgi:Uma2 family endonuclease
MSVTTVATYPQVQTRPIKRPTTEYPETDGKPMAESDYQRKPLTYAVEALDLFFRERADVYVSGNLFVYYEKGDPEAVVAPDVFVAFGVPRRDRSSFFTWQEGKEPALSLSKGPDFVIEITSRATRWEDQGTKRAIYAHLKVREYFQYDPTGDYLRPPLQGFRLDAVGDYVPIPAADAAADRLVLPSQVLGLELRLEDGRLRFYDPGSGQWLPNYQEAELARRAAETRLHQELEARRTAEARAGAAEAELARLRAELARLRAGRPAEET